MAKANPIRFSTQYTDDETDLVCYLHRYYNPGTGRWLSKDPLTEPGFILLARPAVPRQKQGRPDSNPYRFLHNDAVNETDFLGLWYNIFTHCCCKKDGKSELIKRGKIATGIKICNRWDGIIPLHYWVEIGTDWSAGFAPEKEGNPAGNGRVRIPEKTMWVEDPKKDCTNYPLDPCRNDIPKVIECIKKAAEEGKATPSPYLYPMVTCKQWAETVVNACILQNKGCGR